MASKPTGKAELKINGVHVGFVENVNIIKKIERICEKCKRLVRVNQFSIVEDASSSRVFHLECLSKEGEENMKM